MKLQCSTSQLRGVGAGRKRGVLNVAVLKINSHVTDTLTMRTPFILGVCMNGGIVEVFVLPLHKTSLVVLPFPAAVSLSLFPAPQRIKIFQ